jgi:hypothetical protein
MRKLWMRFLAYWRLNQKAVCEMSKGRGIYDDYHDYNDDIDGYPSHFGDLICKHCGKRFRI